MDVELTSSGKKLICDAIFKGPPVSPETVALPYEGDSYYEMYVKLPRGAIVVLVPEVSVDELPEYFKLL